VTTTSPLDRVRVSVLRSLWMILTWVFLPTGAVLVAMNWRAVMADPVRLLAFVGVALGAVILCPGAGRSVSVQGKIAVGLFGVFAVVVLLTSGMQQPAAGLTSIMTMVLAAMFASRRRTQQWMGALVFAAACGVLLRSAGLVEPSVLPPAAPAGELLWSMILIALCILGAGMPLAAVRIYEEANAAQQTEYALRIDVERRLRELHRPWLVGGLAKGMTHDYANLLQAVGAGMENLRDNDEPKYRQRVIDDITQATDRAAETLRALRAIDRPASSEIAHGDVQALCEWIGSLVPPLVGSRIDVTVRCDATRKVALPLAQLEHVILNLIVYYRDAMPCGGSLHVTAVDAPSDAPDGQGTDGVRLRVSDSGAGMSSDILPRIVEPNVTTQRAGGGTGLELAIVASIVNGADGRIDVTSTPGNGTTCVVWLPAAPEDPGASSARAW
jgi:signal transduction histidine kinase